jgi:tetratricopeptide (TPR) repeat protein
MLFALAPFSRMGHTNAGWVDCMAKIALRTYLRDIENLISSDQAIQAMANCRAILALYPKHLAANRLLGNAGILAQDYIPAKAAYLQVLASLPDDLISHIGLSVLLETSAEIEPAVWHMQRAVEIQPGNPALQKDLQRLLRRRTGEDSSEQRLTRYALARMYQKGHLYPQASAEILAALVDEPQRLDLQCLLIQVYRQSGKRQEAVNFALPVLEKLPDCLEANLALIQVSDSPDQAGRINSARRRLEALDPYYAGLSPDDLDPRLVPDTYIQIERPD